MGKKRLVSVVVISLAVLAILSLWKFDIIERIMYPFPYRETVEKYAQVYGVDPFLAIAVMREESHFKPDSLSRKGAVGLMQVMPNTAREIAVWLNEDFDPEKLKDPETNIRYGIWYLSQLNKQFSGDSILVLAAYNAGSGRVKSWLEALSEGKSTYLTEDIPYKETREYVQKVLKSYRMYARLYDDRKYELKSK